MVLGRECGSPRAAVPVTLSASCWQGLRPRSGFCCVACSVCGYCWDGGSHGRQHSRSSSGGQAPTGVSLLGYDFAFSGEDGPSQMALEDLAMFRAIPNCTIFYPSDAVSTEHAVFLAANTKVFLRERWCRQKMCLGSAASLVLMV